MSNSDFEKEEDREEKIDKFLDSAGWYFSQKTQPTGFYSKIGRIEDELSDLNENIQKANESSTKLSKALNNITLAGSIIAGVGVLIAGIRLLTELQII